MCAVTGLCARGELVPVFPNVGLRCMVELALSTSKRRSASMRRFNNQRQPQETDLFVHKANRTTNALQDVAGLRAQQYTYIARVDPLQFPTHVCSFGQ